MSDEKVRGVGRPNRASGAFFERGVHDSNLFSRAGENVWLKSARMILDHDKGLHEQRRIINYEEEERTTF
jgi:hypothetical protein